MGAELQVSPVGDGSLVRKGLFRRGLSWIILSFSRLREGPLCNGRMAPSPISVSHPSRHHTISYSHLNHTNSGEIIKGT
jgi:hypothetical protein